MHAQVFEWVQRQVASLAVPPSRVLDIGSLDINGGLRPLFRDVDHYHGIDLVDGPGVDEVADAATWRPPATYDIVVSAEVLEHAPSWADILGTMWSAVGAGGLLLMTCATEGRAPHSAVDGLDVRPGEHYGNVPVAGVTEVVRSWGVTDWAMEHATSRGDLYLRVARPSTNREHERRERPT